ncbi:MAG: hypothetical protein M1813_007834 [Trichoglossum hirsutum]|nr:MAG: hypothetical protein M1813_007834 [Trichoglossum hirsutum]
MKAATPATLPNSSRRTQPTRQTRTNPPRNSTVAGRAYSNGRSLGAGPAAENGHAGANSLGFFPAITHFTDAITALPKDTIRHFTLLKEVDAKLHGPEEALSEYITIAAKTPAPERKVSCSHVEAVGVLPPKESGANGIDRFTADGAVDRETAAREGSPDERDTDIARRALFHHLRCTINEMLPALDEKNHVISTANEALNKQLLRLESVYPYIECEISEEARYGSLNHWAYIEKPGAKRSSTGPERSRRDVAPTNGFSISSAINDGETVGTRSESRREAMLARKQKVHQVESDFEEGRAHLAAGSSRQRDTASAQPAPVTNATKRSHGNTKAKKAADGAAGTGSTVTNGPISAAIRHPSKRQKTEKAGASGNITSGASMEKTPSTVANGMTGKGHASSPRGGTPAAEVSRKRTRGGGAAGGTSRKKNNTNTSATQSPSLATSPIHGTFAAPKDIPHSSPMPGATQRPASARVRQNSTASLAQDVNPRQRPSPSASSKPAQTNGVPPSIPDVNTVNGRGVTEVKSTTKEIVNSKGGAFIENEDSRKDGDHKDAPAAGAGVNSKNNRAVEERSLKKEDLNGNGSSTHTVQQIITTTTNTRNSGKVSKTTTPTVNTFPDSHHSQSRINKSATTTTTIKHSAPNSNPRSHKKGASANHQQLAAAAAAASAGGGDEEGSSMQGDDEEDDDDSEPRYCYCNQVSYGEMVACDAGDSCPREWFHLDCVGLTKAPTKNGMFLRSNSPPRSGPEA